MSNFESRILAMGTIIDQKVQGNESYEAVKAVEEEIKRLQKLMNFYEENSELSILNSIGSYKVSEDTFKVIRIAKEISEKTEGSFDISAAPLVKLWGIFSDDERVPTENEIKDTLKLVNYKDINLDNDKLNVSFDKKGQMIDLGAIAKGYAADKAIEIYKMYDVTGGFINLGGNVSVYNSPVGKEYWNVGIQNPIGKRDNFIGVLMINNKSVVTSGNYERNFESDGKTYGHIINPKTGWPVESEFLSVTVIADKSIYADGFSTALFSKSLEAVKSISIKEEIDVIIITKESEVWVSPNVIENFVLVK